MGIYLHINQNHQLPILQRISLPYNLSIHFQTYKLHTNLGKEHKSQYYLAYKSLLHKKQHIYRLLRKAIHQLHQSNKSHIYLCQLHMYHITVHKVNRCCHYQDIFQVDNLYCKCFQISIDFGGFSQAQLEVISNQCTQITLFHKTNRDSCNLQ